MKYTLSVLLIFFCNCVFAQIKLLSGNYTSQDGNMTVSIRFNDDNTLTLVEPNLASIYKKVSANEYQTISAYGTDFRLQALDAKSVKTYKIKSPNAFSLFSYSGAIISPVSPAEATKYRRIAQKYHDLMKTDPNNVQVYSFCAAAAIARATYNKDGYEEYARKVILSLKQFLVDMNKCPCEDAIPASTWASVKD